MPERFSSGNMRMLIAGTMKMSSTDMLWRSGTTTIWFRLKRESISGFRIMLYICRVWLKAERSAKKK